MTQTTQEALDFLDSQGNIAQWLEEHGYKGHRYTSSTCPVANYLLDTTTVNHAVSPANAIPFTPDRPIVDLPRRVSSFVSAFDRGDFPSLVTPWSRTAMEGTLGARGRR